MRALLSVRCCARDCGHGSRSCAGGSRRRARTRTHSLGREPRPRHQSAPVERPARIVVEHDGGVNEDRPKGELEIAVPH
eukprot:scaffold14445_cov127-Isochrysis_galbana.AAC.2